jgi:hypothetical protein
VEQDDVVRAGEGHIFVNVPRFMTESGEDAASFAENIGCEAPASEEGSEQERFVTDGVTGTEAGYPLVQGGHG